MRKLSYERFFWFHEETHKKCYPNASDLAKRFETSNKTAQRDIEFFTDRLNAPLKYNSSKKGYYYSDDTFELPAIWLRREEIIALLLAKRLAASIPDHDIKSSLDNFFKKLSPFISANPSFNTEEIEDKISIKNIEYFNIDEHLFQKVIDALFRAKPVAITYYSPHSHKETSRSIIPLHLLNYMGNWHLISWCGLKGEIRDFALSRIRTLEPSKENLNLPKDLPPVKDIIKKQFGIFSGSKETLVALRFSREASRFVKEQIWHKTQAMLWDDADRLTLKIPVSDFREIKREVLKFGSEVEVIEPEALREEVKEEIEKMKKIYT